MVEQPVETVSWAEDEYARLLPEIDLEASKYTRGSVLVAGGSSRYTGAPILAACAAARAGAGYTSLMVPSDAEQVARAHLLSIPVLPAPSADGAFAPDAASLPGEQLGHLDAMVIGPGMGATDATTGFVARMLDGYDVPAVLDADALNVVVGRRGLEARGGSPDNVLRALLGRARRGCGTILTPHDGELKRLVVGFSAALDEDVERAAAHAMAPEMEERDAMRLRRAWVVSKMTGAVVVAKGRRTLVVDQDHPVVISTFASPVLAKAGTGDVLAGTIGSLCAQGVPCFEAAVLGVFIHSKAGECARARLGMRAAMAEDVIEEIATALKELEALL